MTARRAGESAFFLQFVPQLREQLRDPAPFRRLHLQGFRGEIGEEGILLHPGFQVRPVQELRGEHQHPAADVDGFAVIFPSADLAGFDGDERAVGHVEHLHSIGQVLWKVPLDEEPVDLIAVQAGVDGRHLVVVDDIHQRMQDGGAQKAGVHIGVGNGEDVLHSDCKGRNFL